MTYSVLATASQTSLQQNSTPFLETDASGNVSVRTGGTMKTIADLQSIGIGQTWQDVTASRALNTTYTNTTGRPFYVHITTINTGASNGARLTVGGVLIRGDDPATGTSGNPMVVQAVIPNGQSYIASNTAQNLIAWLELR